MKIKFLSIFIMLASTQLSQAQLTIKITHVPANTPVLDGIHLAGNFQNWNPSDANFKMKQNDDGTYQITFQPPYENLEFKDSIISTLKAISRSESAVENQQNNKNNCPFFMTFYIVCYFQLFANLIYKCH